MRKYYQAALAIIAIVSLLSLLFYRHEYIKLRYVLEVLNYFGKPNQRDVETNCTTVPPVFSKLNLKLDEPLSSWQRLDDDLYVYSAYSIREQQVQAIGFGSLDSIKDMQCEMFFENEVIPVLGVFKYVLINSNSDVTNVPSNYNGYHFHCTHTRSKVPVGIAFVTKSNSDINNMPVLPVKSQLQSLNYTNAGICVVPPLVKQLHPLEMLSFISFHDLIGMNNFIIYDFGVFNEFNSYMKNLPKAENLYGKFTYTVIPWNFPFFGIDRNVIRDIIEADCLYRTYNKVKYVATLSWEEYVVLKYHHSLINVMADHKKSRLKADRYKLTSLTFCTEQAGNMQTSNTSFDIFTKTRFDPNVIDNHSIYIHSSHDILKSNIYTREIGKDLVVVNRYKHCSEKAVPETAVMYDTSILRFTDDVYNSPVSKKFMTENRLSLAKN